MATIKLFIEAIVSEFGISGEIEDPLIAWQLRSLSRIFSAIFLVSLVITVGILGRKTKIILALTIVTSALIFFLLMLTGIDYDIHDMTQE